MARRKAAASLAIPAGSARNAIEWIGKAAAVLSSRFAPGAAVHVRSIGKGVVREVRNGGRLLVEVNGRSIVTTEDQVTAVETPGRRKAAAAPRSRHAYESPSEGGVSLDLHGLTVEEANEALIAFINDALLAGANEARIIHGRSGGRLKAAVHASLERIPAVRSYAIDPRNPGVTIAKL